MLLYQMYDFQRAMLKPLNLIADAYRTLVNHPFLPTSYTGLGRAVAAGAEMLERATRQFGKPEFDLAETRVEGQPVPVVERVVAQTPFCRLVRFERPADGQYDPKVLLIAPLSGHHATLLRGTVEALLPAHDVHITDWTDARLVPVARGSFTLDDYIDTLMRFMRLLGPDVHVVAVCQPSVPTLAAVSLLAAADDPAQPLSLTLMGGPIDVDAAPTVATRLARLHSRAWFERTVISCVPVYYPGAFRAVFPGFIQLSGFMSLNLDRHIASHVAFFNHLVEGDGDSAEAHRRFYDEYLSVMDLPAEYYLDTVQTVFQRNALRRGTMVWRGQPVEPGAIHRTALLTVEGERDDISPPGQTRAAQALCRGLPAHRRDHHLQPHVGHFGLFNGRRWREQVMPVLAGFIRCHDPNLGLLETVS